MAVTDPLVRGGGAGAEPDCVADLRLDAAVVSIPGPRADNQDAAVAGPRLLAVADGVGGNAGGALASSLVIEALATAAPGNLRAAVAEAGTRLTRAVAADPRLARMATTLTAAELVGTELVLAHLGDSRAYLLRDGRLEQLTRDQTFVQSLVDAGIITPEQARTHPLRAVVLGALHGAEDDLADLVVTSVPVRAGDRVLLCSDGLSGVVPPETLGRILAEEGRPATAATRLVRAALAASTSDNVTAVVADVDAGCSGWFSPGPPTS
jgi:protein phosphatase